MQRKITILLFGIVLLTSAVVHSWNMFNFPYYENDEGVYMSQAWSLVTLGKIAPYTYWYDHAPAGWMFIALWTLISGGFYTFGFSLNSGRVFMMILQVCSTLLLLVITKKVTKSNFAAVVAGLFFAFSPLGLYFHRRILLDNIMVFWVLLSYYYLIRDKLKLTDVLLSAIFFGISVLTKENSIFFIPGFLVTLYYQSHKYHRNIALLKWLAVTGLVVSLYFLYALLKKEFFPTGTLLGGQDEHVSLLETLKYQSSRDGGSVFQVEGSTFWKHFFLWIEQDAFIVLGGLVANAGVLLMTVFKRYRKYLGIVFLSLFFWLFLMRGGIVIEFYILPGLPIFAMLIGIFTFEIFELFKKYIPRYISYAIHTSILVMIFSGYLYYSQESRAFGQDSPSHNIFESKQAQAQREAVEWIRTQVDPDSVVVIDNHAYIDLQDPKNPSGVVFKDAEWYWKVDQDREIREKLLEENPENIDVIAVTPQLTGDLKSGMSPLTSDALAHSKIWKTFETDNWGVQLWRPYYPSHLLKRSWSSYKLNFIKNGQVIDLNNNYTTSEGQSYALLRAVWMNDKETFDEVLSWTESHLKKPNGLYAWKYGPNKLGGDEILDQSSASDADQDIALALLFASKQWDSPVYLNQAKELLTNIWEHEVKIVNDKPYLLPGAWAQEKEGLVLNPSYLSPFAYRIFAEVDTDHDWLNLVTTSYEVLEKCSESLLGESNAVFLPPEWCHITVDGEVIKNPDAEASASEYSYNAFRIPWKVALDYRWNNDERALSYLKKLDFVVDTYEKDNQLFVGYTHSGEPWEKYESSVAYAANLPVFMTINPALAEKIYAEKIKDKFYEDDTHNYWEDPTNYYTQNWVWFVTAFYGDALPNLWSD